jgi:CBS domain-containing protein
MNMGEICNREVVIIDREDSILQAARLMREYHVGNVIVVDEQDGGRIPVGILTDRDIVRALVASEVALDKVSVGDAMSFDLLTVQEEDDIIETIKKMRHRGVRRVPVVNRAGELQGIVAVDDLMDLVCEELMELVGLIQHQANHEAERQ